MQLDFALDGSQRPQLMRLLKCNHLMLEGHASMTKDFAQIANDVVAGVGILRQGAPDPMKSFAALATSATMTGAIDTKTKELMALAIGIATHCDGCVAYHTKMAHKHGATRQEVLETATLAIYMGGGPAAVYGADAVRAYDQFATSTS